jgi:DNA-directed RNA polymerase subunit E'/Rpb7
VPKVGFCICLYDILEASNGLIGHGTGNANVKGTSMGFTMPAAFNTLAVEFRMIVFRPYKGEIINAKVRLCTPDGIQRKFGMISSFSFLTGGSKYELLRRYLRSEDDAV